MTSSYSRSSGFAAGHGVSAYVAPGVTAHEDYDARPGRSPIRVVLIASAAAFIVGAALGAGLAATVVRMVAR